MTVKVKTIDVKEKIWEIKDGESLLVSAQYKTGQEYANVYCYKKNIDDENKLIAQILAPRSHIKFMPELITSIAKFIESEEQE